MIALGLDPSSSGPAERAGCYPSSSRGVWCGRSGRVLSGVPARVGAVSDSSSRPPRALRRGGGSLCFLAWGGGGGGFFLAGLACVLIIGWHFPNRNRSGGPSFFFG